MPANHGKRRGILESVLNYFRVNEHENSLIMDSDNTKTDQESFSIMLKRRKNTEIVVRSLGKEKILFFKKK